MRLTCAEEKERQHKEAYKQWTGLAQPWMQQGSAGVRSNRPSYEEWSAQQKANRCFHGRECRAILDVLALIHAPVCDAERPSKKQNSKPCWKSRRRRGRTVSLYPWYAYLPAAMTSDRLLSPVYRGLPGATGS